MVTKMETAITTLVIIAILVSASTVWYGMTIMSDVSKLTDSVADLAGSVADLTTSVADLTTSIAEFKTTTAADLAEIADNLTAIGERVTSVEATLTPTITVIGPWSGAEMDAFLPILARFEALSGINVKYRVLRAEDLATLLPAQFAAGTAPGDVIFMWAWWIAQQAQAGHILEVTDLVDASNFLPGTFDQVNVTGKIYGGAYTGKVKPGFWYRKSKFQQWGLTPTTVNSTWAEFAALLSAIAAKVPTGIPIASGDGVGWPLSDITEHFLITFGGVQLQYDLIAGTADWTTGTVRNIFETKLVPTLGNFSTPTEWTTILKSWWDGDYGLYFMGSWITGMVDNATDLGIIPLPGAEALVLPADYFFIPAYTEHPEEAKELFKFLISEEAQRLQTQQGGHIATNINVPEAFYPEADLMVVQFIRDYAIAPDLDDTIGGEFQTTFWSELQRLWGDPTALDTVLANIQAVAP
jgi:multiple sugar transport system substrate-binding protein